MSELTVGKFLHDGLSFRTLVGGSGAAIVFLHGGGSCASNFRSVMQQLSAEFRVIAYDMRGFGETGADARPLTHQLWAGDVAACLDHFELRQAFLVGWSLGAAVALNAASRYPERVEGMALLGAPRPNRTINLAVFRRRLDIIANGGTTAEVVAATFDEIRQTFSPWTLEHRPEALAQVREEHLAHDVTLMSKVVDGYGSQPDWNEVLAKVRCPVTLIVGDADRATDRAGAEELAHQLSHAKLRTVPNCGHYYAVEQPDRVAEMIAEATRR
jgi:3-oxoadipate enol-lactonase